MEQDENMRRLALVIAGILLSPTAIHPHGIDDKTILKMTNWSRYKGIIDASCVFLGLEKLNNEDAGIVITSAFKSIEKKHGIEAAYDMAKLVNKSYPDCKYAFPKKYYRSLQ